MAAAKAPPQHAARVATGGPGIEYAFHFELHRQHALEQAIRGLSMNEIGVGELARRPIKAPANMAAAELSRFDRRCHHRFAPLLIRSVLPGFVVRRTAAVATDSDT